MSDRTEIAKHEAGHCVVALSLGVAIIACDAADTSGTTLHERVSDPWLELLICAAGAAAERMTNNNIELSLRSDNEQTPVTLTDVWIEREVALFGETYAAARTSVERHPFEESDSDNEQARKIAAEHFNVTGAGFELLWEAATSAAEQLLTQNKHLLDRIASEILARGALSAIDFERILGRRVDRLIKKHPYEKSIPL